MKTVSAKKMRFVFLAFSGLLIFKACFAPVSDRRRSFFLPFSALCTETSVSPRPIYGSHNEAENGKRGVERIVFQRFQLGKSPK